LAERGIFESFTGSTYTFYNCINPSTPNDLQKRRAVSPLKIKIPSKNMREKPTNTPIIQSVYELFMVYSACFGITLSSP
jgi:hypothetical protein